MTLSAIDLYMWATPNGYKISIMLEELGLPYRVIPVDIGKGEQFAPQFAKISPNNKIPAIVDPDGPEGVPFSVFESGAILIYLADKTGRFLPRNLAGRTRALEWLMFQVGGIGPMLGQAHHFRHYARERNDYATERYTSEAARLYSVMNRRLSETEFLAGDDYGIADIATYPWIRRHDRHGQALEDFPNVARWHAAIDNRPAVVAGLQPLSDGERRGIIFNAGSHEILFGRGRKSGAL
jgi:GST-like protein